MSITPCKLLSYGDAYIIWTLFDSSETDKAPVYRKSYVELQNCMTDQTEVQKAILMNQTGINIHTVERNFINCPSAPHKHCKVNESKITKMLAEFVTRSTLSLG